MDSFDAAFTHRVLTMGQAAADLVRTPEETRSGGRVEAVFASTFYVALGGRLMCVGHAELEPGPLNCVTAAPATIDWTASGLRPGTKAGISCDVIRVGSTFRFPLAEFQCWRPAKRPLPDAARVARGVKAFRHIIGGREDIEGLGHFLVADFVPAHHQYLCLSAEANLVDAQRWLANALGPNHPVLRRNTAWLDALCGLGPGLTPSGDDFLGGMLIALNYLDRNSLKEQLWRKIERRVRDQGNPISLAHLSAAARGLEGEKIHRAVSAISSGCSDRVALATDGLPSIGHSSGWDIMTGVVTTLEAWLQA